MTLALTRNEFLLTDGRLVTLSYRRPGRWFLQAFLSEESCREGDDPIAATAGDVASGDYLTLEETVDVLDPFLDDLEHHWATLREQLGVAPGATRREGAARG